MRAQGIHCLLQKLSDLGLPCLSRPSGRQVEHFVNLSTPVVIQLSCLISNFCHDTMIWHEGTKALLAANITYQFKRKS